MEYHYTKLSLENMTSSKGNKVANQFIIIHGDEEFFQSYNSIIVKRVKKWVKDVDWKDDENHPSLHGYYKKTIYLDKHYWDYSATTDIYRNIFLNETKKETEKKIKLGEYILTNLN